VSGVVRAVCLALALAFGHLLAALLGATP